MVGIQKCKWRGYVLQYGILLLIELRIQSARLQHPLAASICGDEKNMCMLGESPVLLVTTTTSQMEVVSASVWAQILSKCKIEHKRMVSAQDVISGEKNGLGYICDSSVQVFVLLVFCRSLRKGHCHSTYQAFPRSQSKHVAQVSQVHKFIYARFDKVFFWL